MIKKISRLTYRLVLWIGLITMSFGLTAQENRSMDGSNNNLTNPDWGMVGTQLKRVTQVAYSDGISAPGGQDRPNPRTISNVLFAQDELINDALNLSDFTWVFGQFVDHDLTLVENSHFEPASVIVPAGDEVFAPGSPIFMFRSEFMHGTGTSLDNPREHPNRISGFLDASNVYGSDVARADWLRSRIDGKLKVSKGNLMPWNTTTGEFNDGTDPQSPFMADDTNSGSKLFVSGDIRANENPLLITFHTLFVREHNRLCDEIKQDDPSLSDDQIYHKARKFVGGILQNIVYTEWLPAQGVQLPAYSGYNNQIDPSISNVFSAAAFRLGHTLINGQIIRMNNEGEVIPRGNTNLRDAFFNPKEILQTGGIDSYLIGMATQVEQEFDCKMIDDVRNFLFGRPGSGGLDLAAININRGRERGLPDYNTVRENFGLPRVNSFKDITQNEVEAKKMEDLYLDVDNVDPWVGMLAEYHMPNALFGELVMTIIERQFQALRDGDRFYFENDPGLTDDEKEIIRNTSFRDVIMNNTEIALMQKNVFEAMPHGQIPNGPHLGHENLSATVYPNPTADVFSVKFYLENTSKVSIRIYDPAGRLVHTESNEYEEGENFISIDNAAQFGKGLYHIVLESGFSNSVMKVVKE